MITTLLIPSPKGIQEYRVIHNRRYERRWWAAGAYWIGQSQRHIERIQTGKAAA